MLNVIRKVSENDRYLHENIGNTDKYFRSGSNPGHNLFGKTLGIVGLGHIGFSPGRILLAAADEYHLYRPPPEIFANGKRNPICIFQ